MKKTLILTFGVSPIIDETERLAVLRNGQESLQERTFNCRHEDDRLVVRYEHEDWDGPTGSELCPENTLWGICPVGMTWLNMTVEYTNSFLPSTRTGFPFAGFETKNGESYYFIEIKDRVTVTCLPSQNKVSLFLDIQKSQNEMDVLRRGFLSIRQTIETQLKVTQAAWNLVCAYVEDPPNIEKVMRFKDELFLSIAKI